MQKDQKRKEIYCQSAKPMDKRNVHTERISQIEIRERLLFLLAETDLEGDPDRRPTICENRTNLYKEEERKQTPSIPEISRSKMNRSRDRYQQKKDR
jgi:hypothetical protein